MAERGSVGPKGRSGSHHASMHQHHFAAHANAAHAGTVSVVTHRESGDQRACKRVPKVLELGPLVTERKRAGHLDSLKREISTLQVRMQLA